MGGLEELWIDFAQRGENEPDHGRASLVVVHAGAVYSVALDAPAKILANFFLCWEDGVEVGDEQNAAISQSLAVEKKMMAESGVLVPDAFGLKSQRRELRGDQAGIFVNASGVAREAVDIHQTLEKGERVWQEFFQYRTGTRNHRIPAKDRIKPERRA